MRGSYFHAARSEIELDVVVRDNRDKSVGKRQFKHLADFILIALVLRVDRHGGVSEQSFGTGGRDDHIARTVRVRIADMPEMAVLRLVLHFRVGKRGMAMRTPVDYSASLIYKSFTVKVDEYLSHRARATLVHRERFARPVAGASEPA